MKRAFLVIILVGMIFIGCGNCLGQRQLCAQEPSKEEETFFVAKKAFEDGFYDVSLGLLERFLKDYPSSSKSAEAGLLIGECYFFQDRFLEALNKFETLANQPQPASLRDAVFYWIAEVHFKGNNFSKASEYYLKVVSLYPKSSYASSAYYSLGWCLFQQRDFSGAIGHFNSVEEKFPRERTAQDSSFKIIECLYNLKDYPALKDKAKYYLKAYPKDTARQAYLYFYQAEADYYLDNLNDAIDGYNKVLTQPSADQWLKSLSLLGSGWYYIKLKEYPKAQEIFTRLSQEKLADSSRGVLLLGEATLNFQIQRFQEAKSLYQELIDSPADDPALTAQAYLGKAESAYSLGEYQEAASLYQAAQVKLGGSLSPELADRLNYGLAWSYLKDGNFKEAIEGFRKIVRQTEDKIVKVATLCQIGDAYQDSGDYPRAIQAYDEILKNYPDSLYGDYVQYQLGVSMLKSSNYDGAILAFQNIRNNFPGSKLLDDAFYSLSLAYFQKEDYASSRDILERFQEEFKESPLRPQAAYLLGTSLYNLAKYDEAIEVFKNIIRSYGQDAELAQKAEYEIADCFYQMGNEAEAMARFKMLKSKYPDSSLTPEVIWWLGDYYYRHGDLNLATRYFSSLIQDFPKSNLVSDAYYILGSIYEEQANYKEAAESFAMVIARGKSDIAGQAAIALSDIYAKQGQLETALKKYKEVSQNYPNLNGLIYPKMAEIYFKAGNYDDALDFYRRSLDTVPVRQMGQVQFKIAQALQAKGSLREAAQEYLKITYLYSDDRPLLVKALLSVAAIEEDSGNTKEAYKFYQKLSGMDVPEAKYAAEKLEGLKSGKK